MERASIYLQISSFAVNSSYIRSWLDLLPVSPHMEPSLSKDNAFIMALKKIMMESCASKMAEEAHSQGEALDKAYLTFLQLPLTIGHGLTVLSSNALELA